MSARSSQPLPAGTESDLAGARNGDEAAFARLIEPLQRELRAHCYRMLGSAHDADDALQDSLLRAWRGLSGFAGQSTLRTWLYTVATRVCLDTVARRGRRALPVDLGPASTTVATDTPPRTDIAWLEPYPDDTSGPESRFERRESVELAFVAAVQHLTGNQRAALLLFDVLDFSAAEIAEMLGTTTVSVNSALQRARQVLTDRVPGSTQHATQQRVGDARVRELVTGFSQALETGDAALLVSLLTEDVTWSMPPLDAWYRGVDTVMNFATRVPLTACGDWRTVDIIASGQPAVACYLRNQAAGDGFHAWSINVLDLGDDRISAITSFLGSEQFPRFGLPLRHNDS